MKHIVCRDKIGQDDSDDVIVMAVERLPYTCGNDRKLEVTDCRVMRPLHD